jgi:signal peptidase I
MMASATASDAAHSLKCELAADSLRSSGALRLQVTGWSMLPAVWPGDTLMVERASLSTVSEGEIVLFVRDRRLFAHRVVTSSHRIGGSQLVTKGDAMPTSDAPISDVELLGKVSRIERNGRSIEPSRNLRRSERVVAALVRSSEAAARVIVGLRGMQQSCSQ